MEFSQTQLLFFFFSLYNDSFSLSSYFNFRFCFDRIFVIWNLIKKSSFSFKFVHDHRSHVSLMHMYRMHLAMRPGNLFMSLFPFRFPMMNYKMGPFPLVTVPMVLMSSSDCIIHAEFPRMHSH